MNKNFSEYNLILTYISDIYSSLKDLVLGGFGGLVAYLYEYSKKRKNDEIVSFSIILLMINIFIGAFIGNVAGNFLEQNIAHRDGWIALIGIASYSIVGITESKLIEILIKKYINIDINQDKDKK